MCGTRAGSMIGFGVGSADDRGALQAGCVEIREVVIEGILTVRDEFVRLRNHQPTHVGVPDSYRMDLVGSSACGLRVVWLDGNAHSGIIVWREAGA